VTYRHSPGLAAVRPLTCPYGSLRETVMHDMYLSVTMALEFAIPRSPGELSVRKESAMTATTTWG
jgi:hypothetical protein